MRVIQIIYHDIVFIMFADTFIIITKIVYNINTLSLYVEYCTPIPP